MYYFLLSLIGSLVAFMLAANDKLFAQTGIWIALFTIHGVGLLFASALVHFESRPPPSRPKAWLYLPGILGIGLTWADIYCVSTLGVSTTLSLKLLGQLLGSWLIDRTGWLGFAQRPNSWPQLLTLILATVGCLLMLDFSTMALSAMVLAVFGGILMTLVAGMNAALGSRIGPLHATQVNFLTGLLGCTLLLSIQPIPWAALLPQLSNLPWYALLGGGVLSVFVVAGRNICMPRVSLLSSTLIIFTGQWLTAYLLDLWLGRTFNQQNLVAGLIIALGLSIELLLVSYKHIKAFWVKMRNVSTFQGITPLSKKQMELRITLRRKVASSRK